MEKAAQLHVGYWWRFTRYELRGEYIRPAAGAALERWDPWGEDVYLSLLDLVHGAGVYPPTADSEGRILEWVAKHGLLGILPHETVAATLPARWEPFWQRDPMQLVVTVPRYIRTPKGWSHRTSVSFEPMGTLNDQPGPQSQMGTPVPPSFIAEMLRHGANIPEPGIFRQPLGDSEIRREPLSTWGQFFPDVPPLERETFAYPPPFSDEFWKAYAEPLTDFLMAAAMLRRALEGLRGLGGPGRQAKDAQRAAESSRDLAALLTPINAVPMIDGKRGAVSIRWASGSLLASCAMQALIALSGDGRVVVCTCGKVLISRDPRMMFCSPKCRWKAHQKAHRAKKKQRAKQRQGDSR